MWWRSFVLMAAMLGELVGASAGEPGSFGYPVPQEPNQVFFLQRSMNSNTIVYAANMDAAGKLSRREPIKVYWRRYNDNGEKKNLSFAEDRFAFGVVAKPMPGEANAFRIIIRPYPDRSAVLRVVNGRPRLEAKLRGQEVQLISAFLHLEGEGSMPKVAKVDVWGRSWATGELVSDSFSP
ncbi:DUF4833 domain-containing protein [Aestuariivirga sp.]|uniref:DUF4833 domain-containing protein n=1 Tax=Aestuariivirga sp. TaxID=2650926 RepID=UPI0039E2F052